MAFLTGSRRDGAGPLLRCVVQALSAEQAHVFTVDEHTGECRVISSEPTPAPWPILVEQVAQEDVEPSPSAAAAESGIATALADALRPQASSHRLRAPLWQDFKEYAFIEVRRTENRDAFGDEDRAVLDSLLPSLRLVLRPVSTSNLAERIFETLPFGAGLLDAQCRLRTPNQALLRILRVRDGLLLENGQLRTRFEADQESLLLAIGQNPEGAPASDELLMISRLDNRPSYLAVIEKIDGASFGSAEPLFKFLVSDPLDLRVESVQLAARRFRLTRMEAQVAHGFLSGLDMEGCASQLQISPHTLRWHTKRIMAKTGTTSRTAMVQLFSRAVLLYAAMY